MIENVKIETTHPDFDDYWMSVHIAGRDPFQDAVPRDPYTIQQIMLWLKRHDWDEYVRLLVIDEIDTWN